MSRWRDHDISMHHLTLSLSSDSGHSSLFLCISFDLIVVIIFLCVCAPVNPNPSSLLFQENLKKLVDYEHCHVDRDGERERE